MTVLGPAPVDVALIDIAADAAEREQRREFPSDAFAALRAAGVLAANAVAGTTRPTAAEELRLVREVSRADASVGRILDGHFNAVERLAVHASPGLRDAELARVRDDGLVFGVWGADPGPGEGARATLTHTDGAPTVSGSKTFCSGAGGVDRALVLVRDESQPAPLAVWIDATDPRVVVDESWYRAAGLGASVSHRVSFEDMPVIEVFGEPGILGSQPWFGRDALRTSATWVGILDAALGAALTALASRPARTEVEALAAGRMRAAHATADLWLRHAARVMDTDSDLSLTALHARAAIAAAGETLLSEAARACGSHQFATAGPLDRARRDFELFVLQHRLDPMLARDGARALEERA